MHKTAHSCRPRTHGFVLTLATLVALILIIGFPAPARAQTPPNIILDLIADVDALTARVDALEAENAQQAARLDVLESDNAALTQRIAQLEADGATLASVLSVNANGDLVVTGANLFVQNGAGATEFTVNGKGNLIIGYDEVSSSRSRNPVHTTWS